MFFDSAYTTRPSDTVTKYIIYPSILLVERLFKWSWVLFCYLILRLPKLSSNVSCILRFEIEYSLEFVSKNPPFLSRPSDTKIQTAIIPKIWKDTSLGIYFWICKSQDHAINCQWVIQPKHIDCLSNTFFFNFVIAPKHNFRTFNWMCTIWQDCPKYF